mmetsp:Transcript_216/g.904  ORF Transcript_216/g.904 Transcript_216/m.904 type:complete len:111 (+) Transcript_216:852-1184(+)
MDSRSLGSAAKDVDGGSSSLEDSFECFEELLLGDASNDERVDQPPGRGVKMQQRDVPFGEVSFEIVENRKQPRSCLLGRRLPAARRVLAVPPSWCSECRPAGLLACFAGG